MGYDKISVDPLRCLTKFDKISQDLVIFPLDLGKNWLYPTHYSYWPVTNPSFWHQLELGWVQVEPKPNLN